MSEEMYWSLVHIQLRNNGINTSGNCLQVNEIPVLVLACLFYMGIDTAKLRFQKVYVCSRSIYLNFRLQQK